jgi:hypothetical protein
MSEIRKLAAILVADIVGYSRLAGADEDRILARLRTLRSDLIDPTIGVHHGRVVKDDARLLAELRPLRHGLKGCFLAVAVVDRLGRPHRERLQSAA